MAGWIILGAVLLLIALLLLMRVGCHVSYSAEGFVLEFKAAFFRFRILPKPPLTRSQEEKRRAKAAKKKRRKAEKAKRAEEKKKRKKSKKGAPQEQTPKPKEKADLKWLVQLIRPALRALGQLRRKLRVERLAIAYAIGGAGDPAKAAIRYGQVSAGGGALFPLFNAALDVRDWDIDLSVDFQAQESRVALEATATYRVAQLLGIFLSLGCKALGAYLKKEQNENKKG